MLRADFGRYNCLVKQPQEGFLKKNKLSNFQEVINLLEFALAVNYQMVLSEIF